MAGDRAARRVTRANKWHELVVRAGSEEGANRLVRESPQWAQSYELYSYGPYDGSDEARVPFVLDLMAVAAESEAADQVVEENKGGRPEVTISQATLFEIFRLGLARARSTGKRRQPSYGAIADANGVRRTWVTPIVQWAEKNQKEARSAIALSKTPPRFSTFVRD